MEKPASQQVFLYQYVCDNKKKATFSFCAKNKGQLSENAKMGYTFFMIHNFKV